MTKEDSDSATWYSTYTVITAERILERFNIRLSQNELRIVLSKKNSFYYHLLSIPLKNIFNGIILQQAEDYQVYAQKLFIDYLLSGETNKEENAPGGIAREELEAKRKILMEIGSQLHKQELAQARLINSSQNSLIKYASSWQKGWGKATQTLNNDLHLEENVVTLALQALLSSQNLTKIGEIIPLKQEDWAGIEAIFNNPLTAELKKLFTDQISQLKVIVDQAVLALENLINQADALNQQLRTARSELYQLILVIIDLIKFLPEYKVDPLQSQINKEALDFDAKIGE